MRDDVDLTTEAASKEARLDRIATEVETRAPKTPRARV